MNKKLLITHIDLDAVGILLIVNYFKLDYNKIICIDYKDYEKEDFPYDKLLKYDEITFADISPNKELLEKIVCKKIKLKIYDHHESFYKMWQENKNNILPSILKGSFEIHFDVNKSGSKIFFEAMSKGKRVSKVMKELIDGIDTYDLYKTERNNWEFGLNLHRLLWKNYLWGLKDIPYTPKKFSKFLKLLKSHIYEHQSNNFIFNMYEKNALKDVIKKERDTFNKACANLLVRTDEKKKKFGILRLSSKVSIVASMLLSKMKHLSYLLIINEYKKEELKLSCRSQNDFNLLQLNYTKGHTQASGTEGLNNEFMEKLWLGKEIYELGYDFNFIEDNEEFEIIEEIY